MSTLQDQFEQGLGNFVALTKDQSDIVQAAREFKGFQAALELEFKHGDTCSLAFPSMIIRPDIRTSCLALVFQDRLVVMWKKGTFKKVPQTLLIRRSSISSCTVESVGSARVLVVSGTETAHLALSGPGVAASDAITKAILPAC